MAKVIVLPVAARAADELSDEALLAACSTGDRVALGTLFDRHVDAMTRFVRRLGHVDEQDVDDLVHDTFLEVIRVAGTFRGGSSVRTWLFGIASNVARGRLRAAVRLRSARTRVGAEPPIVAEAVDDALARRQQIRATSGGHP